MRALRKGHASAFNINRDICGKAHNVDRAFGFGAAALIEARSTSELARTAERLTEKAHYY